MPTRPEAEDLTSEDVARFEKQLRVLHRALMETGVSGTEAVELDQSRQGRLSRMDALQAQAMSVETARRREQQLRRIEGALRRIGEDDYGYCISCGELISRRRLRIDPASIRCIDCAERSENLS